MRPPMRDGVCPEAVASAASAQRKMHKPVVKRVEDLVSTCVDCIIARRPSTTQGIYDFSNPSLTVPLRQNDNLVESYLAIFGEGFNADWEAHAYGEHTAGLRTGYDRQARESEPTAAAPGLDAA